MRTAPDGRPMVVKALSGIEGLTDVVITVLSEHDAKWDISKGMHDAFNDYLPDVELRLRVLPARTITQSQSDTVLQTIVSLDIRGRILIKDSDGAFDLELYPPPTMGNYVCTADLTHFGSINARNKSYCVLGDQDRIDAIHEKKIVGTTFSVGGYCFESAHDFVKYAGKLINGFPDGEVYVSHVIMAMIADGHTFHSVPVTGYQDWGTGKDWSRYCGGFKTFFIDIDGVLMWNAGRYFKPRRAGSVPIEENIALVNRLVSEGNKVILTTARPESERNMTCRQLLAAGLKYDQLVMGTLHAGRVLINDFAPTNAHPSAEAINLPRDANLEPYLKRYFKDHT
jgi:hypothetical protein